MKPSSLSPEKMAEIADLHGELEERCELDPLMDTLVAAPVFEFHPPGGALVGGETLRRYYAQFLERFMPLVEDAHMLCESGDGNASSREFQIRLRIDGQLEDHQLVAMDQNEVLERLQAGQVRALARVPEMDWAKRTADEIAPLSLPVQ